MTATYTWDVFCTLDGYGTYGPDGDWGGYWSKQGPELLAHRASLFDTEQRMVFGATTFRENAEILLSGDDPHSHDEWNVRTLQHARDGHLLDVAARPSAGPMPPSSAGTRSRSSTRLKDGVRRTTALAGEPVSQLGPHGRGTRRPPPGDDLPGRLRHDRAPPDPGGCR